MTKEREALKLALVAQPEQEPVARVIDNGTPEGTTEWIPFTNRVEPLKTGDLLYTHADERNFCQRCGKRTADLTTIHTCTPPYDNALQRGLARTKEVAAGPQAFHGFPDGSVSTPNAGGKCVTAGETAPKEST